jgi:hypothetical protein
MELEKIKEDEMGETYSIHDGDAKRIQNFICKTWRKENLSNLRVDNMAILKWQILNKSGVRLWTEFIQHRIESSDGHLWIR